MFSLFIIERQCRAKSGDSKRTPFIRRTLHFCLLAAACVLSGWADTIIETETAWEARPVKSAISTGWSLHYNAAMGQTFTVPDTDARLSYASFLLQTPQNPVDKVSKAFVVLQPWDVATMRPVNDTLWREDILVTHLPAPGFKKYEFFPDVDLTPGQIYVLFFNALGQTREDSYRDLGRFADALESYAGGSQVEVGIGTTDFTLVNAIYERPWRSRMDTVFKLEFTSPSGTPNDTPVPEPSTSALAGGSLLALLAFARKRRQTR